LFALLTLSLIDMGLTAIGIVVGASEMNPLMATMGKDIFIFRMVTVALFIGAYALLVEHFPWACKRALWIVLILMSFVVLWNLLAVGDGAWYG
jgi:hypothetical protein